MLLSAWRGVEVVVLNGGLGADIDVRQRCQGAPDRRFVVMFEAPAMRDASRIDAVDASRCP